VYQSFFDIQIIERYSEAEFKCDQLSWKSHPKEKLSLICFKFGSQRGQGNLNAYKNQREHKIPIGVDS